MLSQGIPYKGLVTLLVPKSQIARKEVYYENGMPYQEIEIQDVMLSKDELEVLPAQVDGVRAQNFKGLGTSNIMKVMAFYSLLVFITNQLN